MPRTIRHATAHDVVNIEEAILAIKAAASHLARADCNRLANAARALAKRADGARRHAERARHADTLKPCEINARCHAEAWLLIWSDSRNRWEIQRNDELQIFPSDDAARDYVARAAADGSSLHRTAIKFTLL